MKKILFLPFLLIMLFISVSAAWYLSKFHPEANPQAEKVSLRYGTSAELQRLRRYSVMLKRYAEHNRFNTSTAFLIDMKLESGSKRFFVYDLQNDSVLNSGLVTHGRCNENWLTGRKFSNQVGCGCTSLGKYKIGKWYYGIFGLAYKLHGLDSTNHNAFRRAVVLHGFECVPEKEVTPYPICQSNGCPSVSRGFIKELQKIIDNSKKPVLMWIFE